MDAETTAIVWGSIGWAIVVLVSLIIRFRWNYPAADCRHSCPNSGACDGCDISYP